jgi:hypothetical protein
MANDSVKPFPKGADAEYILGIVHDHIMIAGDEHMTMFYTDLLDAWRNGENLDRFKWSMERLGLTGSS